MKKENCINRVLMTVDAVGGVWTYAIELLKEYKRRGVEVILVSMGPRADTAQREMLENLDNVELIEGNYKLEWMEEPWKEVEEAGEWLLELEILFHPDVIHLNGYVHAALPWHAPVMVVAHSCVCSWFECVKKSEYPVSMNEYKRRVRDGVLSAECVVAPSNAMLNSIYKNYGQITTGKVIYNGIETISKENTAKESFVLTCGRIWDEAKNIQSIAEIASQQKWAIYAAGEGSVGTNYENFNLLGKLSRSALISFMLKASVFVAPSKYEPFGLSILEAASAGCTLILGDIPSLREIWKDAALFVNPNDHGELSGTLKKCIGNKSLREQYAKRAKERASMYSASRMAEQYLFLYKAMVARTLNENNGITGNTVIV